MDCMPWGLAWPEFKPTTTGPDQEQLLLDLMKAPAQSTDFLRILIC